LKTNESGYAVFLEPAPRVGRMNGEFVGTTGEVRMEILDASSEAMLRLKGITGGDIAWSL
jgi:hypothetical protein